MESKAVGKVVNRNLNDVVILLVAKLIKTFKPYWTKLESESTDEINN